MSFNYNSAKKIINRIDIEDEYYCIHYSCEDLGNEASPRIIIISVTDSSKNTITFSVKKQIELLGCTDLDKCEKALLEEFYRYFRSKKDAYWIHWNMSDDVYGFNAIKHRAKYHKIKDVKFLEVPKRNVDIADVFKVLYGCKYSNHIVEGEDGKKRSEHPRFSQLAKKNDCFPNNFLSGKEESVKIKEKTYGAVQLSIIAKSRLILEFFLMYRNNTLKVDRSSLSIRKKIQSYFDQIKEQWQFFILTSLFFTLLGAFLGNLF